MKYNDVVNWIDIKDDFLNEKLDGWNNIGTRNGYNFLDLFCGAGGLSLGFEMANYSIIGGIEVQSSLGDF